MVRPVRWFEPGNADAWFLALEALIKKPATVAAWRAELLLRADNYGLEGIYKQMMALANTIAGKPVAHA